jgi:hypothetical protein
MKKVNSQQVTERGSSKENIYEIIGTYILVTIIFALIGYLIVSKFMDNVAPFVSSYDGKDYDVRKVGSLESRQTAADYLARLRERVDVLVNFMKERKLPDAEISERLFVRWNKCELKETSSFEKVAAFTLNKSSEIRICIRNKNGQFENPNTSMFVILHELAHVMSVSYGHEEEFVNNFAYITHLASQLGLYKPEDFDNNPKTYCGIEINTTPCEGDTCEFKTHEKTLKEYIKDYGIDLESFLGS